jgi:hypothetical protein
MQPILEAIYSKSVCFADFLKNSYGFQSLLSK